MFRICQVAAVWWLLAACGAQNVQSDAGDDAGDDAGADAGCESTWGCIRTLTPYPVCGTDFVGYINPGFAACACAQILHLGSCVAGEGTTCMAGGTPCPANTFCHPDLSRCVEIGTCRSAADCPAGLPPDGGTPPLRCTDTRCVE